MVGKRSAQLFPLGGGLLFEFLFFFHKPPPRAAAATTTGFQVAACLGSTRSLVASNAPTSCSDASSVASTDRALRASAKRPLSRRVPSVQQQRSAQQESEKITHKVPVEIQSTTTTTGHAPALIV